MQLGMSPREREACMRRFNKKNHPWKRKGGRESGIGMLGGALRFEKRKGRTGLLQWDMKPERGLNTSKLYETKLCT